MNKTASSRAHPITPKKAGKYVICAACYRGIVETNGEWKHIRRVAWTER